MRARDDADDGGGEPRFPVALVDLTGLSDARLRRGRIRRICLATLFGASFVAGVVLMATMRANGPAYLGIALVTLGGVNFAVTVGGLWRVLAEESARRAQRTALRAQEAEHRPHRW